MNKHVLLDQRVKDYLMSTKRSDWFTKGYYPSNDERFEFQQIVLDNLLCKAGYCLQACVTDTISLGHPTPSI